MWLVPASAIGVISWSVLNLHWHLKVDTDAKWYDLRIGVGRFGLHKQGSLEDFARIEIDYVLSTSRSLVRHEFAVVVVFRSIPRAYSKAFAAFVKLEHDRVLRYRIGSYDELYQALGAASTLSEASGAPIIEMPALLGLRWKLTGSAPLNVDQTADPSQNVQLEEADKSDAD
ncbi:MAG: hypothetical protein KF784_09690 [Fimbriimonadaceae bacterium]|nr:hypothetical protein [Fimbriimonadaceae bacterium]